MITRLSGLLVLNLIAATCWAESKITIRVLSYNIHHGEGTDRKLDLERIARVIRSADADIVALQEVDQHVARSQQKDQPAELARLTDMNVVFHGNIPLQGGQYGNAILSRWSFESTKHILLPNHNNGEQRGLIVADLKTPTPEPLRFLATHFDHRRDATERIQSASRVNEISALHPRRPSLLAGDINDTRSSKTLRLLREEWEVAGPPLATIPVDQPSRQIDFIFFRPTDRWKVMETRVLPDSIASDHRAILTVLQLQAEKTYAVKQGLLKLETSNGDWISVSNVDQWQQRRKSILTAMQSIMGKLPESSKLPLPKVTVIDETDCGDYIRRKITYQSQPGNQTPAYLCIPKSVSKEPTRQHPAVLCLHPTDNANGNGVVVGLGGKPNRQYASELASRGYVTLSPSYPLLADYQPDLRALGWESGTLLAIWDNMRGIDLLQSLPYVDRDAIGAIGHSLGGHNAVYTAAFDERLKAVVSSCGLDSYQDYYDGDPSRWVAGQGWTQERYMPRLAQFGQRLDEIPFDFDSVLAAIAPRDVLIIAPLHDSNFRAESVDRVVSNARPVFQLHDRTESLQVLHPDCDHDFPPDMRKQAYRLFDRVLDFSKSKRKP